MKIFATGKRRFNQLLCTNLATPSGFSWNQLEPRNSNSPHIFWTDVVMYDTLKWLCCFKILIQNILPCCIRTALRTLEFPFTNVCLYLHIIFSRDTRLVPVLCVSQTMMIRLLNMDILNKSNYALRNFEREFNSITCVNKQRNFLENYCLKLSSSCFHNEKMKEDCGDGFGNQSYLMVHLLIVATCWFDFDKNDVSPFSDYIYKLKIRFCMYSELRTCPNIQMWFNSKTTTTERYKVKYAIYIYNEPHTFPNVQVPLSNVVRTITFFYNRCVIFLQLNLTLRRSFFNISNVQVWY